MIHGNCPESPASVMGNYQQGQKVDRENRPRDPLAENVIFYPYSYPKMCFFDYFCIRKCDFGYGTA